MPYYFLACDGKIELLSINGSVNLSIGAEDLRHENFIGKTKHCRIKIITRYQEIRYKKRPQCKIKLNHIEFAKVFGNCCWQLCSRYRGGQCRDIASYDGMTKGWPIKRVALTECRY